MKREPLILKVAGKVAGTAASDGKTAIDPMPWPIPSVASGFSANGSTKLTKVASETTGTGRLPFLLRFGEPVPRIKGLPFRYDATRQGGAGLYGGHLGGRDRGGIAQRIGRYTTLPTVSFPSPAPSSTQESFIRLRFFAFSEPPQQDHQRLQVAPSGTYRTQGAEIMIEQCQRRVWPPRSGLARQHGFLKNPPNYLIFSPYPSDGQGSGGEASI